MAEVKSVGELLEQAQELDSDIIARLRLVKDGYAEQLRILLNRKDHLLVAREKLAEAINELIKAL